MGNNFVDFSNDGTKKRGRTEEQENAEDLKIYLMSGVKECASDFISTLSPCEVAAISPVQHREAQYSNQINLLRLALP